MGRVGEVERESSSDIERERGQRERGAKERGEEREGGGSEREREGGTEK